MKNICILVLYLLATQTINGQQNATDSLKSSDILALQQHKIDSLQSLLNAQPLNDSNKIGRLFLLSELCFSNMQYAKGLISAEEAKALANKLSYSKGAALYLQAMAKFHKNSLLGFYYESEADWLSNKKKTLENSTNSVSTDYELEILKLKEAHAIAEIKKDSLSIANIDYALMTNYLKLGEDSIATQYAETPLRIFKRLNEALPVFAILRRKMNYLDLKGNKPEAKELELQAVKAIAESNDKKMIALIAYGMGGVYHDQNRFGLAIEFLMKSDDALEELGYDRLRITVLYLIGETYDLAGLNAKAIEYYEKSFAARKKTGDTAGIGEYYIGAAFPLIKLKRLDEANAYISKSRALIDSSQNPVDFVRSYDAYGQALMAQRKYRQAIQMFMIVLPVWEEHHEYDLSSYIYYYLSQCHQALGELKQSLYYAQFAYQRGVQSHWPTAQINASLQISDLYERMGNVTKAYEYLKIHKKIKDGIQEEDNLNKVADIEIQSILEKSQRELDAVEKDKKIAEATNRNQQLWIFSIAGALLSAILVLFILYRNNRQKQKANAKIEQAYVDLKSAQAQLIQSEKMASLGELTAGIAHEIQNPLNFVNNFSEINTELIEDLKNELAADNKEEALLIADDIKDNEQKIIHHGKRADSIVKGMLQHSKASTGKKDLTDINALVDESLRLSYHGLRAKNKDFNATINTDFDEGVGKIDIVSQDISRVLLNLFNNAFYAVNEKKKQLNGTFEPVVSVRTARKNGSIILKVIDNGNGIPQSIINKIFQPFFTTKPTGQGTGLGLSLSYDIVKAHGGEIKVESKEREGTEFIIQLPI